MKRTLIIVLLSCLNFSCEMEERASYATVENTLPPGGVEIDYDEKNSFRNIDAIRAGLSGEDARKFDTSLSWYGTESSYGLDKIDGKTARQLVDIVNCLKQAKTSEQQKACFR